MRTYWSHESRVTSHAPHGARGGFTLVEMIVVIAITGILAAAVAVFIRRPVESYVDAARRAELTDIADGALRRITREPSDEEFMPAEGKTPLTARQVEIIRWWIGAGAPNGVTIAPSAARLAATLPAPPRQSVCEAKSTTGTAASGESFVAEPQT